ncbi:MAG: iron-sulfur cluster insertion protein ErpA [Rhodobiaceae bacterium]|jgi:iron-sulfur cluster assembly accessory protein|nr:iron-sulfur cluster insertion protein ErpA [Rhodobiaceae bacterium]
MEENQFGISESAAVQIGKILATEADGACLRVAVQGGGCSGFSYVFSIDAKQTAEDLVVSRDGVTVLVDDMSLQYMQGSEIDWVDDLIGASFQIKNPNATANCGCGTSFDV